MNNKNLSNKIATIAGLFLGAFALSALAIDWTPPTANPPANNTKAPINVSASPQAKEGPISIGKVTNPTTGYKLDVAGSGMFTGLLVTGKTITDTLQIGSTDVSRAGYVLTNKDGTGEAEWKPNTAGLSGASRIYCAAASDGTKYYIPNEAGHEFTVLIDKINTEISSELGSSVQLLNISDLASDVKQGLLKTSFKTKSRTENYTTADRAITNTNAPRAYCPGTTKLLFHSLIGSAKDERNNTLEQMVGAIYGNYTDNYISCVLKGKDRPKLIIGMGLCI